MKQPLPAVFACLIFASAAAQGHGESVKQQLGPMLHEMDLAANAHDTDRFMKAYLHDPSLVFVIDGEVIHGWDDLRAQQLKWWNDGKTDVVYSTSGEPEIEQLTPSMAIVTETLVGTRTLPDGSSRKREFAVSMVWKKLPEGWRIVYAHESSAR
jgi:ketosteroid isomerase-like protein